MNKDIKFLIVTANENETMALLEDKEYFRYETKRSTDPRDPVFYNIGMFGQYNVVHFELTTQGTVGSDAAQLAIYTAINEFKPDAVILVGIAFGKDFADEENPSQHIGDILVSAKVQDYECGKIKDGRLLSDGVCAECGRQLYTVVKHYYKSWDYYIDERKVLCEFGTVLSGDKVVDDRNFKETLIRSFPRCIGGEMEGRGAYATCRNRGIEEWIIIKAICDWADGTKSEKKQENQITASRSAISLLKHIFSDPKAFEKIPQRENGKVENEEIIQKDFSSEDDFVGYFINFGLTSCRLLKVLNNKKGLKESNLISYEISDPKDPEYLSGIISYVKNNVLPLIKQDNRQLFIKAFADTCFTNVFANNKGELDEKRMNKFIWDFYSETSLYFNILSKKQTEENLRRQFKTAGDGTAIVNIGTQNVDILVQQKNNFVTYDISITLSDISEYLKNHGIDEEWDEPTIESIKAFIRGKIGQKLEGITAKRAIIIKDELSFMRDIGYPLVFEGGYDCLSFESYKSANREFLFGVNYKKIIEEEFPDKATRNRLYGFKNGHIILETIFECLEIETVIPSDELSIHGNINAYIFNVAISGSTHDAEANYMLEAIEKMKKMGARVLSPVLSRGKLKKKTNETDINHAIAIRECDLLFISNKDGYIGEQTGREIYGAYLLNKPIAFWKEPDENKDIRLSYVPHEKWWDIMRTLEEEK